MTDRPEIRRVLVTGDAHEACARALSAAHPALAFRGRSLAAVTEGDVAWADAYVGFRPPPVPTLGGIRWVHCTGAGVDAWLWPVPLDGTVLLTRSSESFGPRIAEWVLARVLAEAQGLPAQLAAQRATRWAPHTPRVVAGRPALVVGTGDIGTHVARMLRGCGLAVTGVSRTGATADPAFARVAPVTALADLVGAADVVVLTVPLTRATHHLVDRTLLARMRGAFLVNVGRGAVVDEAAMPHALDAGWLRGAALDVFETEPLPPDSPLWRDPRVMVSPHVSGLTTVEGVVEGFGECLAAITRGDTPRWAVDRARGY